MTHYTPLNTDDPHESNNECEKSDNELNDTCVRVDSEEEKTSLDLLSPREVTSSSDLTNEECVILQEQMDILLEPTFQVIIYNELIQRYPKLDNTFSIVHTTEAQAAFVCKMTRKGYLHICNSNSVQIYNILRRHSKYGIQQEHILALQNIIKDNILKHESIAKEMISKSEQIWSKANDILHDVIHKAYKGSITMANVLRKRAQKSTLQRNRQRISRSMSDEDISCVVTIWKQLTDIHHIENKDKVATILATKIQTHTEIYLQFRALNVDVFTQATVIIDMLDKTIKELQNTDQLIPFLKRIGTIHRNMGVTPQLVASMKAIILELIKDVLSFAFTVATKDSWNRVLTFIAGTMILEMRGDKLKEYSSTLQTNDSYQTYGAMLKPVLSSRFSYYSNDVMVLERALTADVIIKCQSSWNQINSETMIHAAVKIFYQDLLNTQREIRRVFSKSNMVEQVESFVRGIGSTVALLDDLEALIPILEELGKRHVYYGVRPEYFAYVKRCWFSMLKKALTIHWNKQIHEAWHIVWDFMTYYMKQSLEDALLLYIPADPTSVNFRIWIHYIHAIDFCNVSFYGDIWCAAYTGDNSSQSYAFGKDMNINSSESDIGALPFGGVRCLNAMQTVDKYIRDNEERIRYFEENDTWYIRQHLMGTFTNHTFELQCFPFDTHYVEFVFALCVDDSVAKWNKSRLSVGLVPFQLDSMAGAHFNVHLPKISLIEGYGVEGKQYTYCQVMIPIARKYEYHVYNVILPLIAIEMMAFAIYFTDYYPITPRLIMCFILFLTVFALRVFSSIKSLLPSMPYLTLMDHIFNAAYVLCVYHVIGACLMNQFQYLSRDMLKTVNILIAGIALFIFLLTHIYFGVKAMYCISLFPNTRSKKGNMSNQSMQSMESIV